MSIPTSLIVVLLVAAWLAVLVPIFAKRREQVPETEMDGGTFRVLRRASASIRRRPNLRRAADEPDADQQDELSDAHLHEELLDADADDSDLEDDGDGDRYEYDEVVEYVEVETSREPVTVGARRAGRLFGRAELVAVEHEDDYYAPAAAVRDTDRADSSEPAGEAQLRPIPRRPGRGGYDPDAAEVTRAYRFSRRRRVATVLLLATVAFSAGAYLFKPVLWSGAAVFGLLLVAYLGYLRRQVRIENEIQQRRLARLRRARQIRPEYEADRHDGAAGSSRFVRSGVPVSQVPPPGFRRGRQVVDLDDDDPSFDDLEYYQPAVYRRASGQ